MIVINAPAAELVCRSRLQYCQVQSPCGNEQTIMAYPLVGKPACHLPVVRADRVQHTVPAAPLAEHTRQQEAPAARMAQPGQMSVPGGEPLPRTCRVTRQSAVAAACRARVRACVCVWGGRYAYGCTWAHGLSTRLATQIAGAVQVNTAAASQSCGREEKGTGQPGEKNNPCGWFVAHARRRTM